jgi:hypothetical protein
MDAVALLSDFRSRGIRLIPNPPRLTVGPASRLTDAAREAIRAAKAELLAALAADRIAALDAQCNARDEVASRGYDYEPPTAGAFRCVRCLNDPARCEWCADHADDPGVLSCGDCERGRMKGAPVIWRQGVTPNPLIPDVVRAIIESIEADARAQGWPAELLWNAEFWGSPRGLAAVLEESDAIAEVTPDFIAIIKTERSILRFQRRVS